MVNTMLRIEEYDATTQKDTTHICDRQPSDLTY
jgi:hypothetical protein